MYEHPRWRPLRRACPKMSPPDLETASGTPLATLSAPLYDRPRRRPPCPLPPVERFPVKRVVVRERTSARLVALPVEHVVVRASESASADSSESTSVPSLSSASPSAQSSASPLCDSPASAPQSRRISRCAPHRAEAGESPSARCRRVPRAIARVGVVVRAFALAHSLPPSGTPWASSSAPSYGRPRRHAQNRRLPR